MHGHGAALAALALALGLLMAAPSGVSACTSEHPTFAEAVQGARAIARVTVVEGFDTYYDEIIHPMWTTYDSQGVLGSAGVPSGARTLDELETAILAELGLPDTSTDEAPPRSAFPLGLMIAAALLALVATIRRSGVGLNHRGHTGR